MIPGEITVKNFVANEGDITPPAKITDLSVQDIEYVGEGADTVMVFTLQWTAVGDDMDEGQGELDEDILVYKTYANLLDIGYAFVRKLN